jgi:SAM-dependent methyltransferase
MPIKLCCIDAPDLTSQQLSFSICKGCNTIQLDKLIPLNVLYSSSHNTVSVGKVWEGYFTLFCKTIEQLIINKNILEIGDPSGRIANASSGFSNWYIIEPNKNENIVFKQNIHFISAFFDENFNINKIEKNKTIDIIVHSHVFEHMYSPNTFLKKCYEILVDDGEMIFGIPNMEHIALNELAPCLGIFFEHTIFLNKENVSGMLIKNGFKII